MKPKRSAREEALLFIARRPHFISELRTRLLDKGHSDKETEDAIELLVGHRYLDDAELADAVVREADRSHRGPQWVYARLRQRGAGEDLADAKRIEAESFEERAALRYLEHRSSRAACTGSEHARIVQKMIRRGFATNVAQAAIALFLEGEDDPPPQES